VRALAEDSEWEPATARVLVPARESEMARARARVTVLALA